MRVTILGCGDAFGSGGRFNTCFMIETKDRTVLLDCGASSLVALRHRHIEPNRIDGIILSHLHGDHFGGLPFFLLDAQFLSRRERPLTIAGPPGTRERTDAALEVFYPRSTAIAWRFAWNVAEIVPGEQGEVLALAVATAEVLHQSGAPSTAVRLSDGKHVLAYSGDTEWTDALVAIADGADLFIVECYEHERRLTGHMSWVALKARLPDLRARAIMITHMGPAMLARRDEALAAGVLVASDDVVIEM
jgi:ribonuclease BN (tRNA processing enzyme)